ncbi:Dolichyl-diphosphooligosaccharide-protein glycosyltransferase [Phellopilus nigrolimitatus]|nr:Dolichyl-diphosphooligosaccharide-protein glycosyltransferase [Phellopilus nigrolimitatus]
MRRWFALAAQLVALVATSYAKSSTGDSVLVVLEKNLPKENFSTFFSGLEEKGYELTFRDPKEKTPVIIEDDVPQFAHVILFAPTAKSYAPDITPQSLITLLSNNVDVIFALSPMQTPLSSLAAEFSLILPPPHTPLISHFPARDSPHTIVPVDVPSVHPVVSSNTSPVLFSGTPHAFGHNPLLVPILKAPSESFAAEADSDSSAESVVDAAEKGGEGLWAGSQLGLVTGFQTLNGARALWVGGVELFSDEFAQKEAAPGVASGNARFSQDVATWTFQETNVLRIDSATHYHAGVSNATKVPETYTVNDQVTYTAHISKWDPVKGEWAPHAGLKDLQLDFTMLDPHIRTALPPIPGSPGTYSVTFRAPDRHGVFKFVLDYKRRGWSFLNSAITVPVVPPRHDGYPRFLSAAWPYYAGAISTSAAFVLFTTLWLAGDVTEKRNLKGKKAE